MGHWSDPLPLPAVNHDAALWPKADRWEWSGPLITLGAAVAYELLGRTPLALSSPTTILAMAVLYAAFVGSGWSAGVSAGIMAVSHAVAFSVPGAPFRYAAGELHHLLVVATFGVGLVVVGRSFRRTLYERWRRWHTTARWHEERFRSILEFDPDGVIIVAEGGGLRFANAAAGRVLGYAPEDLTGEAGGEVLRRLTRPDGTPFPAGEAPVTRALETGEVVYGVEAAYERPDGRRLVLALSAARLPPSAGAPGEVVVSFRDTTEQKRTEEGLRFLAEAGSGLAESLDYATTLRSVTRIAVPFLADWCTVDLVEENGEVERVEIAHADPETEAMLPERIRRDAPPLDSDSPVARVLRTGRSVFVPEVTDEWLERAARSPKHLEVLRSLDIRSVMIVPLTARGRTIGAMTCSTAGRRPAYRPGDLALAEELAAHIALAVDNARLYRKAQEASQAKSDFLAVMSHELRTPLSAIMGFTDLMRAEVGERGPEAWGTYLRRIRASALHLLQLIEEILSYARMEAGRERVRIQTVDLAELTRDTSSLIEPIATEKDLEFALRLPDRPVMASTDPAKVRQILLNLLSNAVKFTDRGGVTVELAADSGRVAFQVRDTGVGIAAESRERIFDAFWQVDQSTTRRAGGTGLGLSVVRRLARMLGGEVEVESTPGVGSTFTVVLPAQASTE